MDTYKPTNERFVACSFQDVAASLPLDHIRNEREQKGGLQSSRPSMIWKAYAHALQSQLTQSSDLSSSGDAIFVASPLQFGVPAGTWVDDTVRNYHIYVKADPVQDNSSPFYDPTTDSYFERLCT
jgi:hypothetical protein